MTLALFVKVPLSMEIARVNLKGYGESAHLLSLALVFAVRIGVVAHFELSFDLFALNCFIRNLLRSDCKVLVSYLGTKYCPRLAERYLQGKYEQKRPRLACESMYL